MRTPLHTRSNSANIGSACSLYYGSCGLFHYMELKFKWRESSWNKLFSHIFWAFLKPLKTVEDKVEEDWYSMEGLHWPSMVAAACEIMCGTEFRTTWMSEKAGTDLNGCLQMTHNYVTWLEVHHFWRKLKFQLWTEEQELKHEKEPVLVKGISVSSSSQLKC